MIQFLPSDTDLIQGNSDDDDRRLLRTILNVDRTINPNITCNVYNQKNEHKTVHVQPEPEPEATKPEAPPVRRESLGISFLIGILNVISLLCMFGVGAILAFFMVIIYTAITHMHF